MWAAVQCYTHYAHNTSQHSPRCEALYDRLMELDDVDAVYTNADGLAN